MGSSTTGGGANTTIFGGSGSTGGFISGGGGGGAVITTIFSSTGAAFDFLAVDSEVNLVASSGCSLQRCSSRHSALILSRELEGTRAAMPNDLAFARISLFSKPYFFAMSYIRTGINFYRR